LCTFADNNGFSPPIQLSEDMPGLVRLLTAYIQWAYGADVKFHVAKHAVLSVQYLMRQTRGQLRSPWDAIESWSAELDLQMRPPFPFLVLRGLVGVARTLGLQFLGLGKSALAAEHLCFAILLEAAFFGLLRPGEMFKLGSDTVGLPEGGVLSGVFAVVAVLLPKNPRAFGRRQFAVVRDEGATAWLTWALKGRPPGFSLWPWTQSRFRKRLAALCAELGLEACGFVPASARAGGATHFYLSGIDPSRLRFWGRWAAESSLNHYIQEATAGMILRKLPVATNQRLAQLVDASQFSAFPPAVPSLGLFSYGRHLSVPV
jgi:hypothetical protein